MSHENISSPESIELTFEERHARTIAVDLARELDWKATPAERVAVAHYVAPRLVELFAPDEIGGQENLFETWEQMIEGTAARFVSTISLSDRFRFGTMKSPQWRFQFLIEEVKKLEARGVPAPPAPAPTQAPPEVRRESRPAIAAAKTQPSPRWRKAPSGLALLQALPEWDGLLPVAQWLFV